MDWLAENWFWVLVFILFIAMHMFGHGGHGGHAGHINHKKDKGRDNNLDDNIKNNGS